ncbi:hypothetical protein BGZ93_007403 [Podila epicladia]|nr:hypothetical protein BGZ93_007403 [Podila epicladia]
MELLISQHQVEMQNLRCQLEATGRKRKKRLALARGGEDESTMEPEPSQMKDQSQKVALGDRVSNSIAVLKNMSLLQHNVHLLSVGRDQKRWMLSHSGHENMVLAAISSMCIIIGVLTGSVVTAVNNLMEAQTTAQMGELDASLESDSGPVRKVYMDLEQSWLELLNLTHACETSPMTTTDMASVITINLLSSLFSTALCGAQGPDLRLCNQTFLANGFVRVTLRTLIDRLGQVVEAESATVPIRRESRLRSSTRSTAKAKVRTRLRVGYLALNAHYKELRLKKECGWIIEKFVLAVKRPTIGRLVQRAFGQDASMNGK